MRLSKKAIEEYQRMHLQQFGETLTIDEANQKGIELLTLINLLTNEKPVRS